MLRTRGRTKRGRKYVVRRRAAGAYRRAINTNRMGRSLPALTHMFKRDGAVVRITNTLGGDPRLVTAANGWLLGNTATDDGNTRQFGVSCNFQLRDVIEYGDFTALFDRYKIVKVALKILYQSNIGTNISNILPIINYTFDADDSNVPTILEDVTRKGYVKTKILNANRPMSWVCKPRIDKSVFSASLVTPAYTSEPACWLDCNSASVEHYAFKAWFNSFPVGGDNLFSQVTIQPVFYLALKDSQ